MAQTPQEWLAKNLKWITILLLVLLLFKSTQSCTRSMNITAAERKTAHTIDSLTKKVDILERQKSDTIKYFQSEIKVANSKVKSAEKNVEDVKEVAKRTTIINNIQKTDTIKKK